ncbi:MAG: hypothetical protein AAGA08_10950 [Pseudomonadota bacterium]
MSVILIMGSGPNVLDACAWDSNWFDHILAINNAHGVRDDWDSLIHPEDFPPDRMPMTISSGQSIVTAEQYVPAQNQFGGFIYAGGTMAFTAGYWALAHHRPTVIGFIGCDMTYANSGNTHFYGTGTADPLRDDITLQSLEAKSSRLEITAAAQGCALRNLSTEPSRLTFPRASPSDLNSVTARHFNPSRIEAAQNKEAELAYFVQSGRYWEACAEFDPAELRALDTLWLAAGQASRDT